MPAKITIQSGISAGASHWIEQRVVRVGSDPTADVCLPSTQVPSHALTIEYRDGSYRVYNRCRGNVFIGTRVVEPNRVATWFDTDILQLDDVELVLDIDEDPTPVPVRHSPEPESYDFDTASPKQPAESSETKSNASRTAMQLAVIILCIVGSALLLLRDKTRKPSASAANQPTFEQLVRQSLDAGSSHQLISRLQFAEQARIRGDRRQSRERYARLQKDLVAQQQRFENERKDVELAIARFVNQRLSTLSD